jgi:hypothetical protein
MNKFGPDQKSGTISHMHAELLLIANIGEKAQQKLMLFTLTLRKSRLYLHEQFGPNGQLPGLNAERFPDHRMEESGPQERWHLRPMRHWKC